MTYCTDCIANIDVILAQISDNVIMRTEYKVVALISTKKSNR